MGHVRIIGGTFRNRKLVVPDLPGLRPTPNRLRETLFNWLQTDIRNAKVLDLCAGSGALGFEALSRGASHVTFVDLSRKVQLQLKENLQTLGVADKSQVIGASVSQWVKSAQPSEPYDLIFFDPPFDDGLYDEVIQAITTSIERWVSPNGFLYIETTKAQSLTVPNPFILHRESTAGSVTGHLWQRQPNTAEPVI